MPFLRRKFIDLIHDVSSDWANWNPLIPIKVGAYGEIEYGTGELRVKGNVYDVGFQTELDKLSPPLRLAEHLPLESCDFEDELVISSRGAKRVKLSLGPEVGFAGLASATIQGQWEFKQAKRDALLIMHRPKTRYIPPNGVLERLFEVPMLKDKWLVTQVHICPAYSMYLSDKSGEKLSLVLSAQVPVPATPGISAGGEGGVGWWSDSQSDLLRKACHKDGAYSYTPLYTMKRRIGWAEKLRETARETIQRVLRQRGADGEDEDEGEGEGKGDNSLESASPPWEPLDEDGEEDPLEMPTTLAPKAS